MKNQNYDAGSSRGHWLARSWSATWGSIWRTFRPARIKQLATIELFPSLARLSEIGVVGFFVVLASWYWPVQEHAAFVPLFLISALLAFERKAMHLSRNLAGSAFLSFLALLFWVLLSTLWSSTFHLSLSYAGLVVLIAGSALLLGVSMGLERVIVGVLSGVLVIVGHGLATVFLASGSFEGYFRETPGVSSELSWGLFTNPSSLSFYLGIGVIASVFSLRKPVMWLVFYSSIAIGLFIMLWGFPILTAFFSLFGALLMAVMLARLRTMSSRAKKHSVATLFVLVPLLAALAWFFREELLEPFGVGPDLRERTVLWEWYFGLMLYRPVLGAGWGQSPTFPLGADNFVPTVEWFPAHNGFIDLGLMLGVVGIVLLLASLLILVSLGALRSVDPTQSFRNAFIPSLLTYLFLNDIMATSLPKFIGFALVGLLIGVGLRGKSSTTNEARALPL